jgi:hypothetical protein
MPKSFVRPARPGEESIQRFARRVGSRLRNNWDLVIGVCGEEGSSKSTFAVVLGWYLDLDFGVRRNVIGSPNAQDVAENLLGKLPKYSPVILDEAIKVLYKLGWQNQAQILLNTVFSVCRAQNKAVLLCMPRFLDFNTYQRQHRIKIWIECVERGHAFVFMKDKSPFIEDSWHIKENQKLIEKHLGRKTLPEMDKEEFYEGLRKTKTYAGELFYGVMPEDVETEYNALKAEVSTTFDLDDAKGVTRLYKNAAKQSVKVLYTDLEMTQQEIASAIGLSIYTVNNFLKGFGIRPSDKKGRETQAPVIL